MSITKWVGVSRTFPAEAIQPIVEALQQRLPELQGFSQEQVLQAMRDIAEARCIWLYQKLPTEFAVAIIGVDQLDIHCMGKVLPVPALFCTDSACAAALYRDLVRFAIRHGCQYITSSRRVALREYRMSYLRIGKNHGKEQR